MEDHIFRDRMGLPVTCSSREALQVYDEMLLMYVSIRESALPLAHRVLQLDPGFVLAHCLLGSLWLSELAKPSDPRVSPHVEAAKAAMLGGAITERERRHVHALLAYAAGDLPQATEEWASLLMHFPLDIQALRVLATSYIMLGEFTKQRDFLAALLPHWNKDMAAYPSLLGYYAFSLDQTNYKDRAEQVAREAIALERRTPWAIHALSHVIEEARPAEDGVEFLTSTRENWASCLLGGHINWHLSLYHLELQDMEAALREYDTVLAKNAVADNRLGLLDASSFLWRLNLMGVDTGSRWQKVTDEFTSHIGKHGSSWYDCHLMFSLCHGKVCEETARLALARQMMKSLEQYAQSDVSTDCAIADKLGVPCCQALLAYGSEQYHEVITLLLPLRYDLRRLGGSWAQRQIFNLTMIQAAIRGGELPVAMALVAELKAQKPNSRSLVRLFDKLKSSYDAQQQTDQSEPPATKKLRQD